MDKIQEDRFKDILSNEILYESLEKLKTYSENVLYRAEDQYDFFLKLFLDIKSSVDIMQINLETLALHQRNTDKETIDKLLSFIYKYRTFLDEHS